MAAFCAASRRLALRTPSLLGNRHFRSLSGRLQFAPRPTPRTGFAEQNNDVLYNCARSFCAATNTDKERETEEDEPAKFFGIDVPKYMLKEHITATPDFNRWLIPPAAVAVSAGTIRCLLPLIPLF
jgi:hypothetical protein